jgi:hypothetical protein
MEHKVTIFSTFGEILTPICINFFSKLNFKKIEKKKKKTKPFLVPQA